MKKLLLILVTCFLFVLTIHAYFSRITNNTIDELYLSIVFSFKIIFL